MIGPLPPMRCRHCGVCEVPTVGPGTGPHVAKALCSGCGKFLRWLPKALLPGKETPRMGGVNRCILVGAIGKHGVEIRYATSGTPIASFALVCSEVWQNGTTHDIFIPCEVLGKRAEQVGELEPGALVLFEGKLARRRKGEVWDLVVSGFELTPVGMSLAATARTN